MVCPSNLESHFPTLCFTAMDMSKDFHRRSVMAVLSPPLDIIQTILLPIILSTLTCYSQPPPRHLPSRNMRLPTIMQTTMVIIASWISTLTSLLPAKSKTKLSGYGGSTTTLTDQELATLLMLPVVYNQRLPNAARRKVVRAGFKVIRKVTQKQPAWWEAQAIKANAVNQINIITEETVRGAEKSISKVECGISVEVTKAKTCCFDLIGELDARQMAGDDGDHVNELTDAINQCKGRISKLQSMQGLVEVCKQDLAKESAAAVDRVLTEVAKIRESLQLV